MYYSIKEIARLNSSLSKIRKDNKPFDYDEFIKYANENIEKYNLIERGDDLLVNSWYSNSLMDDYKLACKKAD
jgi:hypothetical protein